MNLLLRRLLAALADAQTYRRSMRVPWVIVIGALIIVVGICAGSAYVLWLYWPTLLLINSFGVNSYTGGIFALWQLLYPALAFMSLPLQFARLEGVFSSEPYALALALRCALEAGDPTIAPAIVAPSEEGEPATFASAPTSADSLVVAIPDALILPRINAVMLYIIAALLLLMAAGGAALAPTFLSIQFDQLLSAQTGEIYLVAVCGSLTFFALLCILLGRRQSRHRLLQRRGVEVALDDLGVSFRQPVWKKRRRQIAWADMRGLGRYTYKDTYTREHNVYILTSDEQTLMWEEPPTERYASQSDQQIITTLQHSSWALVSAITRRTKLPIRDLSGALTTLVETPSTTSSSTTASGFLKEAYDAALEEKDVETTTALWRLRRPHARRQPRALRKLIAAASGPAASLAPATPDASTAPAIPERFSHWPQVSVILAARQKKREEILRVARALIPYYPTEDAPTTPRRFWRFLRHERTRRSLARRLSWAMALMIVALFATTGVYAHDEQGVDRLEGALPQQVAAQKPLYYASLVNPQSDWTAQKASKDDPTAAAFVHSAYQVSCNDPNSAAIFSVPQYDGGDIAIAVTVAIHRVGSQADYTSAGLLFDATDNGDEFSSFGVDAQGDWNLSHYSVATDANNPWNTVDSNSSDALRTGDNTPNTLLLIRHGSLYLLYVNGVMVERYYDSDHTLSPGGGVGVYIDACDITASFNDFAIYAVPAPLASIPVAPDLPGWLTN